MGLLDKLIDAYEDINKSFLHGYTSTRWGKNPEPYAANTLSGLALLHALNKHVKTNAYVTVYGNYSLPLPRGVALGQFAKTSMDTQHHHLSAIKLRFDNEEGKQIHILLDLGSESGFYLGSMSRDRNGKHKVDAQGKPRRVLILSESGTKNTSSPGITFDKASFASSFGCFNIKETDHTASETFKQAVYQSALTFIQNFNNDQRELIIIPAEKSQYNLETTRSLAKQLLREWSELNLPAANNLPSAPPATTRTEASTQTEEVLDPEQPETPSAPLTPETGPENDAPPPYSPPEEQLNRQNLKDDLGRYNRFNEWPAMFNAETPLLPDNFLINALSIWAISQTARTLHDTRTEAATAPTLQTYAP